MSVDPHVAGRDPNDILIVSGIVLLAELDVLEFYFLALETDDAHGLGVDLVEPLDELVGVPGSEAGVEGSSFEEQLDQFLEFFVGLLVLRN